MNTRLLRTALHATSVAIALLLLAGPARADIVDPNAKCSDSDAAVLAYNPSYVNCTAHFNGVPAPQTTLPNPFGPTYGSFAFIGQTTNALDSGGPFVPFGPGVKVGTLTLDMPQTGTFVIALASYDDYSLYLYDASGFSGGVGSIEFSTLGTTKFVPPKELLYANLYAPVPEPASVALMLAGLAATGLALHRRKA